MLHRYGRFLALLAVPLAYAGSPLESGNWVEDNYSYSTQQCRGGVVNGNNFYIPVSPSGSSSGAGCSNGHLRAERRYNDDYSSGVHQFGGKFTIKEMTGTRISIKQTFNGDAGPFFILGVDNTGRLYNVEGGTTIASGVAKVGATVQINTVHNADIKAYRVYVNGKIAYSESAPGGEFYDKIGAYTTDSGEGDLSIDWTDVQFWHRED